MTKREYIRIKQAKAPDDWTCVWEKQVNSSLTKNTGAKKATEKLFTKVKHAENT